MLDPTYTKAKEISDIIANFRSGELCFEMNADHVLKWAQQFSADAIDVILEETYELLSRWYISDEQITDFLTAILSYLDKATSRILLQEDYSKLYLRLFSEWMQ